MPVARVQSLQGAEHCSWTEITFLLVGPERTADWYVRDTGGDFSELLRTTFARATLPEGATDTGLRRDGRQLWIGPDEEAAHLADTGECPDASCCCSSSAGGPAPRPLLPRRPLRHYG